MARELSNIEITETAENDLVDLSSKVADTFFSKVKAYDKNLELNATPQQTFNKRLSGNMHPILQMNLGRDFRAWFVEGEYIEELEDGAVYALKVMTKKDSKKLTGQIQNALAYSRSVLE
jgi:mRNA-degrading endonuclease RelE of RelBE toxin-antitoxin system